MPNPPPGCDDPVRGSHRIAIEWEQGHSRGHSLTKFLSLVETNSVFVKNLCSKIQVWLAWSPPWQESTHPILWRRRMEVRAWLQWTRLRLKESKIGRKPSTNTKPVLEWLHIPQNKVQGWRRKWYRSCLSTSYPTFFNRIPNTGVIVSHCLWYLLIL